MEQILHMIISSAILLREFTGEHQLWLHSSLEDIEISL